MLPLGRAMQGNDLKQYYVNITIWVLYRTVLKQVYTCRKQQLPINNNQT